MVWPAIPFLLGAPVDPSGRQPWSTERASPTKLLTTHLLRVGNWSTAGRGSHLIQYLHFCRPAFLGLASLPSQPARQCCLSATLGLGPRFSKLSSWEPGSICLSPGELKVLNLVSQECSQITNSPLSNSVFSSLHPRP